MGGKEQLDYLIVTSLGCRTAWSRPGPDEVAGVARFFWTAMRVFFSTTFLLSAWTLLHLAFGGGNVLAAEQQQKNQAHAAHAIQLTPENFHSVVANPDTSALVEFYAPWCGHCRELAPEYDKAALAFAREPEVVVAQVNADQYREVVAPFGIQGFPTILWFPALSPKDRAEGETRKQPLPYKGERTEEDLIKFVNTQAGTFRISGGSLASIAGRMPALDRLLNNYVMERPEQQSPKSAIGRAGKGRAAIKARAEEYIRALESKVEAKELSSGPAKAAAAQYYRRVLDKVSESDGWLPKETARLEKMLASNRSLTGFQVDDITRKLNVLHAAVDPKLAASLKNVAKREKAEADKARAAAAQEKEEEKEKVPGGAAVRETMHEDL